MPTFRVDIEPALLEWAIDRSRIGREKIYAKKALRDLPLWQSREKKPTYTELKRFAQVTHAPFGMLFLNEPPVEKVPIPDFRTIAGPQVTNPSPDLLETIYICQERQEWYRDFAIANGLEEIEFVGSATIDDPVGPTADKIRRLLEFTPEDRASDRTWSDAFRRLIDTTEDAGILVMVSGIVGNNTHRKLDPSEFRGFALSDSFAPLIFVNGADTKAAQIFTLIHEVAHIWLGQSALTDTTLDTPTTLNTPTTDLIELWCNRVAAEVLIPLSSFQPQQPFNSAELDRLARIYKVSTLVVLRRIYDANLIGWNEFHDRFSVEKERVMAILESRQSESGGNYYYTQPLRISQRFAHAVISDALAGKTLYRDAYRLVGARKHETFLQLGEQVGVI